MIISSQRPSLNKIGLCFKYDRTHSKEVNMKKVIWPVYKCSYCDKLGHLETWCFNKLKMFKGINPRPFNRYQRWNPSVLYRFSEALMHIKLICAKQSVYLRLYNNAYLT